jgi:hypothetical protein
MDTTHLFKPGATRNRVILIALWLFFYASFTLFTPPLLDDADSVHAEVAREMLLRHDWVTLYANGIRYLEKAPLLYWSMAASFKVFGIHTAAARLPLALTVLALALALEAFARRAFHSTRAGLYAALSLLSSFGIFIFTRITIPDAMVCLWLTLALLLYWLTEQPNEPQIRVPHLRDGLIVAKVGIREANRTPSPLTEPQPNQPPVRVPLPNTLSSRPEAAHFAAAAEGPASLPTSSPSHIPEKHPRPRHGTGRLPLYT